MPPTTAPTRTRARRWSVALALQLAAALLATGAASATGTGELVWLGESAARPRGAGRPTRRCGPGGTRTATRPPTGTANRWPWTSWPTSVAVDGAGVARLLGGVGDPADGHGTLVKLGDGVLDLGGDHNRYRGGTVVAGGTLLASAAHGSATGSGPVTVQAAAVLGGAGGLRGPVTVERGGTVAPGHAPGDGATLATGGRLALRRGAVLDVDLAPRTAAALVPARRRARPRTAAARVLAWRSARPTPCGRPAASCSTRPSCG
jgi:autotransporter-associated beta strand protein